MKNKLAFGLLFVLAFSFLFGSAFATSVSNEPVMPNSDSSAFTSQLSPAINQYFEEDLSSQAFSIVGASSVTVGTSHTYDIDLTTPAPDQDYTDGWYETQYGYWAMLDRDQNIIEAGNVVEVFGTYTTTATVTVPDNLGDFVIVSAITQINSYYDFNQNKWIDGEELVMVSEALNLETQVTIPVKPQPSGLSIWDKIWASLQSIIDLIFG